MCVLLSHHAACIKVALRDGEAGHQLAQTGQTPTPAGLGWLREGCQGPPHAPRMQRCLLDVCRCCGTWQHCPLPQHSFGKFLMHEASHPSWIPADLLEWEPQTLYKALGSTAGTTGEPFHSSLCASIHASHTPKPCDQSITLSFSFWYIFTLHYFPSGVTSMRISVVEVVEQQQEKISD